MSILVGPWSGVGVHFQSMMASRSYLRLLVRTKLKMIHSLMTTLYFLKPMNPHSATVLFILLSQTSLQRCSQIIQYPCSWVGNLFEPMVLFINVMWSAAIRLSL
jgi:hypothetical protein